jgi:predicted negative regulator of RcsB-dependent stress response
LEGYTTETEQLQALKKWWDENAKWIIGGLLIAALVVGGWKFWGYWQGKRAAEAGGLYAAVVQAEQQGNNAAVDAAAQKVLRAYPKTAYGALAGLALAKSQFAQQHLSDAIDTLQGVIKHSPDAGLAIIARIRIARIQLQRGNPKEALEVLKGYEKSAFAATVQSLRGDAFLQLDQTEAARNAFREGLKATKADSGLHQLLSLRLASLPEKSASEVSPTSAATAASLPAPASASKAAGGRS